MKNNEDILRLVFKRNDEINYEIGEDGLVTIIEKQNHPIQRFFRRLKFSIPLAKKITLDQYGSAVFLTLDSNYTVQDLGEELDIHFGEEVHPLYERLLLFLNHLHINCGYIQLVAE